MSSSFVADAIFYGGDVITMDNDVKEAEAIAVVGGKIKEVGNLDTIRKTKGPHTKMIDLKRNVILPGFIEPHCHIWVGAFVKKLALPLGGYNGETKEDLWLRLEEAVANTPKGDWIYATQWNPILVRELTAPHRKELDDLSTEHIICVLSFHGHSMFCNTKAFEVAGIPLKSDKKEADGFLRDEEGLLTGQCLAVPGDAASNMSSLYPCRPNKSMIEEELRDFARAGFTTVAALGMFYTSLDDRDILQDVASSECAPVRLVVYEHNTRLEQVREILKKGVVGEDGFCPVGVKWHADGSPYSGSMAPKEPYLDSNVTKDVLNFPPYPHYGYLNYESGNIMDSVKQYHVNGWQLAAHAHGDRAIDQVLDIYDELLKEHPRTGHRHRIEHCGMITKDQIERALDLGVTLSFFPDHVHYYGRVLRDDILGEKRAERFMPLNEAKEAGHRFTMHQDSPCGGPLDPMLTIQTAVTRAMRRESPDDDVEILGESHVIDVHTALKAYTIDAAWQTHHDDVIGSITPDKIADFTVLSENPYHKKPLQLSDIRVLATYRRGELVQTK